jgi:8-oxo-dGTP diphosphatase
MALKPIESAGGIVVRKGHRPLIAVVQRRKDQHWVLPRGKLKPGERPVAAARREAFEETGHKVSVHDYLGVMLYHTQGVPKLVQFWHMRASKNPSRDPMHDISAIAWLSLSDAIKRLTNPLEKIFLQNASSDLARQERQGKQRKDKTEKKPKRPKKEAGSNSGGKRRLPSPRETRR